jgi:hypothetical protein
LPGDQAAYDRPAQDALEHHQRLALARDSQMLLVEASPQVLDERGRYRPQLVVAEMRQQVRAPYLEVAPLGRGLERRHDVSRPPVFAHELGEGEARLDHARREGAQLAPALDVDLEGRGIASFGERARELPASLSPADHVAAAALLDAH